MQDSIRFLSMILPSPRKHSMLLGTMRLSALRGIPEIRKGNDLSSCILRSARSQRFRFQDNDVLVVAQKIVSKAEGRCKELGRVTPSRKARTLAKRLSRDPRVVELILRESRRVVRATPQVFVVETKHGFVCANAGIDTSNVLGEGVVSLLPKCPDASARRLAQSLRQKTGKRVAIIISDTFGRPWRLGLVDVAIGAAGLSTLMDLRGQRDRVGKLLHATIIAVADQLAAAAGLVMEKAAGRPVVVIRGYRYRAATDAAARIVRPAREDLFR